MRTVVSEYTYVLEKKREYGDGIHSVESASFTPLVFSTFGGLGREASIFYSRLANLLAVHVQHNTQYKSNVVLNAVYHLVFPTTICHLSHLGKYNTDFSVLSAPPSILSCAW